MELNKKAKYFPNRGKWIQTIKTSDIVNPEVVVNSEGEFFKARYRNPFEEYVLRGATNKRLNEVMSGRSLEAHPNTINFAVFCATSGLGIAQEHFKNKQPLFASLIRFHLYYHVRKILYTLEVPLPDEQNFKQLKNSYSGEKYLKICVDYGVDLSVNNADAIYNWRNQYFYSSRQGSKLKYLNGDSWARWIMPKSQGLTKQGLTMLGESIRVYVDCLLTAQSSVRTSITGSSARNFEAQDLFVTGIEDYVKDDTLLHEDIKRYQEILSNAKSAVDFSIGKGIYMLPSDLTLKEVVEQKTFNDKLRVGKEKRIGVVKPVNIKHVSKKPVNIKHISKKPVNIKGVSAKKLTLHEQRLSNEHQEELQSLVLVGSLAAIGIVYFLK